MDFLELVKKRYSVRKYKPIEIENEKINQLLQVARLAPTAANKQPFELYVIKTKGKEKELREIYDRDWFSSAPIIICACAKPTDAWVRMDKKNYSDIDVAIVVDHIILAATELGLGSCWIANFNPAKAKENLKLKEGTEPLVFVSLGYADDLPREKLRKEVGKIARFI